MALFRRFFYRKPPDRLLEISERVYVFDCCFSTDVLEEDEYKVYMGGIVSQLQDHFPDASFMVFNFSEGEKRSHVSDILSHYDMTVMEYPRQYQGCPLLPLEMVHHFLRSSESWLSLQGQQNVVLMHCERGGWPVLAFMLAGLLLYRKQYNGEQKTLEMVYKQAPKELLHLLSALNPQPSQLRYLQYISIRNLGSDWPPSDTPLFLDCLILRVLPLFDGGKGCRPVVRVYGQDPFSLSNRSCKLLFSTTKKPIHPYLQAESMLVKIDIHCLIQGDVVLECINLDDDLVREEVMFRVVFHTAFVWSNILILNRDEVDVLWDSKDHFPRDFRAEVLFSDIAAVMANLTTVTASEDGNEAGSASPEEFFEVEEIFSSGVDAQEAKGDIDCHKAHENKLDGINHKEVMAEDLDPHSFQDCPSNDTLQKKDGKMKSNSDAVKDIAVDDVKYTLDKLVDSDPDAVKDITVDVGGIKSSSSGSIDDVLKSIDTKEVMSNGEERQKNLGSKDEHEKLTLDRGRPKSIKTTIAAKQKTKQQESQGVHAKQEKPSTVPRWFPPNKGSYSNTMHVSHPPSRYNSAPPSLGNPTCPQECAGDDKSKLSSCINAAPIGPMDLKNEPQCPNSDFLNSSSVAFPETDTISQTKAALSSPATIFSQLNPKKTVQHSPASSPPARSPPSPIPIQIESGDSKLLQPGPHPSPPQRPSPPLFPKPTSELSGTNLSAPSPLPLSPTPPPPFSRQNTGIVSPSPPPPPPPPYAIFHSFTSGSIGQNTSAIPIPPPPPTQNPTTTSIEQSTLVPESEPPYFGAPPPSPPSSTPFPTLGTLVTPPLAPALPISHGASIRPSSLLTSPPIIQAPSSSPPTPPPPMFGAPTPPQPTLHMQRAPPPTSMHGAPSPQPQPLVHGALTPPPPPLTLHLPTMRRYPPPSDGAPLPPIHGAPPPPPLPPMSGAPPPSRMSGVTSPPPPPPMIRVPPSLEGRGPPPTPPLLLGSPPPPTAPLGGQASGVPFPPSPLVGAPPPPPLGGQACSAPPPPPPPGGRTSTAPPPPFGAPPPPPPIGSRAPDAPPPPPSPGCRAPDAPPPPPSGGRAHGAPAPPPPPGCRAPGAPPPPPPPGGGAPGAPAPPAPLGDQALAPPGGAPPPPPPGGRGGRGRGLARPTGASATAPRRSSLKPLHWIKVSRALQGSLWEELQRHGEPQIGPEFDVSEIETLFSANVPKPASSKAGSQKKSAGSKNEKVNLIDLRRAYNTEIMLTKVKMPLPDVTAAVLAMDESVLDVDQVENLIKFCPTKEEMETLKGYTGDKENLGKCEQYFLELMKVPRVESKLRVFAFKIQFGSQITEFKRSLNTVNSACLEVRQSFKLKEIMKKILYLGNTLNQGTARGSAVGFKMDSLLKLTDTRASNNKMTLMHYLCKVLAEKSSSLLDFHLDLASVEPSSKIQLKSLAEEMQAIIKGLEKVKQELVASANDGAVCEGFHKTLKGFVATAETEAASVTDLYAVVGRNADALALYFGEDPARCPFEQVTATLLNFMRLFRKAHEENLKQAELEKKKAEKESEVEKTKGVNLTKKSAK